MHHHMVLNKINPEIIQKLWTKGRPTIVLMEEDGEYSELAAYFLKGRKRWKELGGTGKQYSSSRNLVRPVTVKEVIKLANRYYEKPTAKKGYYVKPSTETHCIHEGGYPYMKYILVQNERRAP